MTRQLHSPSILFHSTNYIKERKMNLWLCRDERLVEAPQLGNNAMTLCTVHISESAGGSYVRCWNTALTSSYASDLYDDTQTLFFFFGSTTV